MTAGLLDPRFIGEFNRRLYAPLGSELPPGFFFSRAAGPNSYQNGPAVDGQTFISLNAGVDVPRFHYCASLGRSGLLIEPARTNECHHSNFVDTTPANNVPDGWSIGAGVAGTDFTTQPGPGPHGGIILQIEDTDLVGRGCYHSGLAASSGGVVYADSGWYRRLGTGGPNNAYGTFLNPGTTQFSIGTGPYDWTWFQGTSTPNAGGAVNAYILEIVGDPAGLIQIAMPQQEVGAYASTFIPTDGAAPGTRAVESCPIDPALVNFVEGRVRIEWVPFHASTVVAEPVPFCWNSGASGRISWNYSTNQWYVLNDGVLRLTLGDSFSAFDKKVIDFSYGPWGMLLNVDGAKAYTATPWVEPGTHAPYLGALGAAGSGTHSAVYGAVEIWG